MTSLALSVEIIYTLSCALVDLIVLFLNPIIISVIYNDRHLRRQPSIMYIANLALVDLFFASVNFINIIFHFLHVMKMYPICIIFHAYFPLCFTTASLLFMFTNSVDRFVFIRMSLKYHTVMNSRVAKRVTTTIWIFSMVFPVLPYVIFDQVWMYNSCSDIVQSKAYRYAHAPLQAIFFTTIVITALMFISVFRVVKNSRKLRHVPIRTSSLDSHSTTLSTPTLTFSTPALPPISELIPYDHEINVDPIVNEASSSIEEDVSSPGGDRQNSLSESVLSPEDSNSRIADGVMELLVQAKENNETVRICHEDIEKNHHGVVFELKCVGIMDKPNELPTRVHDFSTTSRETVMSRDDSRTVLIETPGVVDDLDRQNDNEEMLSSLQETSFSVLSIDENHTPGVETKEERSFNKCTDDTKLQDCRSRDSDKQSRSLVRKRTARNVSFKKTKKRREEIKQFYLNEGFDQDTDSNISPTLLSRFSQSSYNTLTTAATTEPLELLNFKLHKWSENSRFPLSIIPITEDYSTMSRAIADTPNTLKHRNVIAGQKELNNENSESRSRRKIKVVDNKHSKRSSLSIGTRKRTASNSDSSSVGSLELTSSFTQSTLDSVATTEDHLCSVLTNNESEDPAKFNIERSRLKSSHPRRKNSTATSIPIPGRSQYKDSRLPKKLCQLNVSFRQSHRLSADKIQRPNRLSLLRVRSISQSSSSDSPRPSPRLPKRSYQRNISTASSSSPSIPFGTSAYSGRDVRTLKVLFLMFCVYIILWLPAFLIQVLRYFDFEISLEISVIGYTFGVSNSVFNFFVYPMRIPKLRIGFKHLFAVAAVDLKTNINVCLSAVAKALFVNSDKKD